MSKPLVATYWLLDDPCMPQDASLIPPDWHYARFGTTDILYVCSFYVLPHEYPKTKKTSYKFGLQNGNPENGWLGKYADRYKWVVAEARTHKPSIGIIACMMMWNDSQWVSQGNPPMHVEDLNVSKTPESRAEFAPSVKALLLEKSRETYKNHAGMAVSAHMDGFDINLEDGNL